MLGRGCTTSRKRSETMRCVYAMERMAGEVAGFRPGGVHTQAKPRRREKPTWVFETLTSAPPRLSRSAATRV